MSLVSGCGRRVCSGAASDWQLAYNVVGMKVVSRSFSARDLVGGHPAFDLVNTVTARNSDTPIDWLDGYPRLVEWAHLAQIAQEPVLDTLGREATGAGGQATRALLRLKEFREALYTAYVGLVGGTRVPTAVVSMIQSVWHEAQQRVGLEHRLGSVCARLDFARSGLDFVRDTVALPAVEMLLRLPMERVRVCPGERCGWLFFDSSKGGQRVWCDMGVCGNAAKARRFLEVRRGGGRKSGRGVGNR